MKPLHTALNQRPACRPSQQDKRQTAQNIVREAHNLSELKMAALTQRMKRTETYRFVEHASPGHTQL
jgi:hypothetical protein